MCVRDLFVDRATWFVIFTWDATSFYTNLLWEDLFKSLVYMSYDIGHKFCTVMAQSLERSSLMGLVTAFRF